MSRRKGGFFGWLRKLFSRSKTPEQPMTTTAQYNPAPPPVHHQYYQHQHPQQHSSQYGGQGYYPQSGYGNHSNRSQGQDYGYGQHHHHHQPQSAFHQRADEIAQIQVAGMRRTAGGGYVQAYANRTTGPDPDAVTSSRPTYDQTTVSSYGTGGADGKAWGEDKYEKQPPQSHADSAWRGKPIGKQYDRREELTEDDEDMWARMAM